MKTRFAWLRRLAWPRSLRGRMAAILIVGMLAAQAMTSSIWFDLRHREVGGMALRLVAAHLADSLSLLESAAPEHASTLAQRLSHGRFSLTLHDGPLPPATVRPSLRADQAVLESVLADRLGAPVPVYLLDAQLIDDSGHDAGAWTLLTAREPGSRYRIAVALGDERWVDVQAHESQAGLVAEPLDLIADYVLRIYLLRILIVVAIALLAVRLVMRPLQRLAAAAQALGTNLHSPPLPEDGPQEVRAATQAFNLMQHQLIEGIGERTRLLAAVSHDLRSPIARMRLRTELLPPGTVQDKFRKDLDDMEAMTSAALDLLRGHDIADDRRPVDINALLDGLCQDLRETGADVTLIGHVRTPLPAFASSLRRCLQNLMENAVRYGGRADVSVDETDGRVRIIVADPGPGIPEALLERVFEPFYRVEASRNPASGGFGMGLSIARTVAQAHGATLVLRNRDAGGLDAVLELPRP